MSCEYWKEKCAHLSKLLDESQEQRRRANDELERTAAVLEIVKATLRRVEGERDELRLTR